MVTTPYFSLQENPYLFTYRNSNYLPTLTNLQEKLEVRRGFLWLAHMRVNQGAIHLAESVEASMWFFMSWNPMSRLGWVIDQVCGCLLGT